MNVLIVNDDGIESEGLRVLAERVGKEHEVYVLAPDSNRSATSHHVKLFQDLELRQSRSRWWSCAGMPADCTSIGLKSGVFSVKFDAVLSGINCGPNLGTDIVYSGTCAGARQAVLNGVPGIAVSVDPLDWEKANKEGFHYVAVADFVAANLDSLVRLCAEKCPGTFVNINAASLDAYRGVRYAGKLCVREYSDNFEVMTNSAGTFSHYMPDGSPEPPSVLPGSDLDAVRQGYIALSCVYAQPVAAGAVDGISFKV